MFKDQVITVWMIIYDGDASRIYTTTNFDKLLSSVEGSLRGYCGDESPAAEDTYDQILRQVRDSQNQPCIPMQFNSLRIVVYRWELDNSNPIHQVLRKCHNMLDDGNLKDEIIALFSTSVFT
jgi:hypothetical protein